MKVLITGIDGFTAKYLARHLVAEGCAVTGSYLMAGEHLLGIPDAVELAQLDVTDAQACRRVIAEAKPDVVFHLAAQSAPALSWQKPQLTARVNIEGTINVLEAARELPACRIVLIGSGEEYGLVKPDEVPIDETQPYRPRNLYGVTKIAQSMLMQLYVQGYEMDILTVRAFNHIGPGQSEDFVVSGFASQLAQIQLGMIPPVIHVGNLTGRRDFTDVRDMVRAYRLAAVKGERGCVYNIGTGVEISIREVLDRLIALCPVPVEVREDPERYRPCDVPVLVCDNTKFTALTGWAPRIALEDTLKDILADWLMRWKNHRDGRQA
jgi:GDP-4-dehydro-6-deoxy-D-mannose reductase